MISNFTNHVRCKYLGTSMTFFLQDDVDNLEAELDEDDPLKIQPNGEDFLVNYKTPGRATSDQQHGNNNTSY